MDGEAEAEADTSRASRREIYSFFFSVWLFLTIVNRIHFVNGFLLNSADLKYILCCMFKHSNNTSLSSALVSVSVMFLLRIFNCLDWRFLSCRIAVAMEYLKSWIDHSR